MSHTWIYSAEIWNAFSWIHNLRSWYFLLEKYSTLALWVSNCVMKHLLLFLKINKTFYKVICLRFAPFFWSFHNCGLNYWLRESIVGVLSDLHDLLSLETLVWSLLRQCLKLWTSWGLFKLVPVEIDRVSFLQNLGWIHLFVRESFRGDVRCSLHSISLIVYI